MDYSLKRVLPLRVLTLLSLIVVLLNGCSTPAYTLVSQPSASPPPPSTQIYFYPTHGQTKPQQDRDRYECYLWATKQSGFNPSQAGLAPHQRIEVKPVSPPGTDTAAGAIGGAVVGSLLSSPHDNGQGMVFGAITGGLLGAASDAARQQQTEQLQQHFDANDAQQYARLEQQARAYRRAMSACLEGRGYSVQ
ncbi:MAG: glycine zipper 2TM domain-containing protein [Gammaproteobacteria bacterium]|nr:glycine zipper 2TM domain-containing protein [Gammaproteobacteria bacterium]